MTAWLRSQGYAVNHKRVARLTRQMGLETIYTKPRTSHPEPAHRVYPSLLRGVPITQVNQVWSTDITSIRLHAGFVYLVAVMDWFSQYVLSWVVSITMDVGCCLEALEQALGLAKPDIFNSDQGAQFTSVDFTGRLASAGIRMSMDGRGRALDNVFVERLWRKRQICGGVFERLRHATRGDKTKGLEAYFEFYNGQRLHQSGLPYSLS